MSNFLNNANKNWSVVAGQIQNQAANGIVYIKESAFEIPTGASNDRPSVGEAGMIRYLNSDNVIEYYNANTGVWIPISQQPPNPLTITPTQLLEPSSGQFQTFTIIGENFASGCFVEFIGQDLTIYGDDQTNFINSETIQALFSSSNGIYDASFNEPFSVRVSNPSGLFGTLTDAIVSDERPTFTNAINLGSVDSSQNVLGLLADLTGTDPDSHYPLIFDLSNGSTLPGTIDLSNDTTANAGVGKGFFLGNAPIVSVASTTYNPYFVITDASNNTSFFERFNFTVRGPLNLRTSTAITSGGTIDISFTDSTGTNYISDPSYGGYTIYTFKASSNTTNAVFTFEPDNWTDIAECLIVGGGGGGGSCAGGGGAGGFINDNFYFQNGSVYDIQVGGGGEGAAAFNDFAGNNGGTSFIGTSTYKLNAFGGGGGAALQQTVAGFGGCGGGGGYDIDQGGKTKGASGATTALLQGFDGGDGNDNFGVGYPGGGGGGAGGPGGFVTDSITGPNGGVGLFSSITGVNTGYAGGGGASILGNPSGSAGFGGGGSSNPYGAADGRINSNLPGISATPHTGSGGGAGSSTGFGSSTRSGGGAGGSGIVVIKIPSYPLNLGENRLALSNSSLTYDISYMDMTGSSYLDSPDLLGITIYTFKQGSGTITPNFTLDCSYLVVAGGGGGGTSQLEDRGAGGGGAGGLQFGTIVLNNSTNYSIQCGAGGVGGEFQIQPPPDPNVAGNGENGGNSVLNGITSIGGGYGTGIKGTIPDTNGGNGGSGGGGRNGGDGGLGTNTQGNNGGGSSTGGGGGGGGYASSGTSVTGGNGGNGGGGYSDSITGTAVTYAAGGGGGGAGDGSSGGTSQGGGSGAPGYLNSSDVNNNLAGNPNKNTGSGGGGGGAKTGQDGQRGNSGSNGSNGVVILRFPSFGSVPTLNSLQISATNGTADIIYVNSSNNVVNSPVSGGFTVYSFTCTSNLTTANFSVQPNTAIAGIDFLMVAGGGAGAGGACGGGGGAGGVHISTNIGQSTTYSATDPSLNLLSQSYNLSVGNGGLANGSDGNESIISGSGFSTITSTGGGGGFNDSNARDGGSGGGIGLRNTSGFTPGSAIGTGLGNGGGNTLTSGNPGGGGGGGALAAGTSGTSVSGQGGIGITTTIRGSSETFAGGGSAGGRDDVSVAPAAAQTIGGGGAGSSDSTKASNGTQSKGGGGGGGGFDGSNGLGGDGGSGIIVLRIPSFA